MNPILSSGKIGKTGSDSSSESKKSPSNNQKKSQDNIKVKKVQNPKFYVNDYMKKVIKEKASSGNFFCHICPEKPLIQQKSVYRHILESAKHENSIPEKDAEKHEEMSKLIRERVDKNKMKRVKTLEQTDQGKKSYLKFIGFCQKLNLSFQQISELGKYIKEMVSNGELAFLNNYSFDREEISLVARCFGKILLEELKNDLEESPFSLSLDNSTIARINICALKVCYLKQFEDEKGFKRTHIQNKILGIKYLKESTTAKTLFETTQQKLFDLSEEVKANFVGFVHDHASSLSGPQNGLGQLMKENLHHPFLDLKDPCHSLNLVLSNSFENLPSEMTKFVEDIHNHFSSPQRVAYLNNLQKGKNMKVLNLKHYAKTRWLSLGQSLTRLLEIWESLIDYMKSKPKFSGLKNKIRFIFDSFTR